MFKRHVDKDYNLVVIKCKLASIVRREYRNTIVPLIGEKSVEATKICALGSLLFLNRAQAAFDTGSAVSAFFDQRGEDVIRKCFQNVVHNKRKRLVVPDEFGAYGDDLGDFEWPSNAYFGNILAELCNGYCRNVTTNLNTHLKKRLREFLRMRVYECNQLALNNPNAAKYDDADIVNTIDLAMGNAERVERVTNQQREEKRNTLMAMIRELSWYDFDGDNVMEFTRDYWFQSVPMWLAMQREIHQFNTDAENRDTHRKEQEKLRKEKRKAKKTKKEKCNENQPPTIKNLVVIPICSFLRTHITMSSPELFQMFCETGCCPKNKDGTQIKSSEITENKQYYWNQWFDIAKIFRLGKRKKQFHYTIVKDGVGVSILYEKKKAGDSQFQPQMTREQIIDAYLNGHFIYELGIDPGMKTWNATVRRTIATGKEVRR